MPGWGGAGPSPRGGALRLYLRTASPIFGARALLYRWLNEQGVIEVHPLDHPVQLARSPTPPKSLEDLRLGRLPFRTWTALLQRRRRLSLHLVQPAPPPRSGPRCARLPGPQSPAVTMCFFSQPPGQRHCTRPGPVLPRLVATPRLPAVVARLTRNERHPSRTSLHMQVDPRCRSRAPLVRLG